MKAHAVLPVNTEAASAPPNDASHANQDLRTILHDIKDGKAPASAKPLDLRGFSLAGDDLSGMDL